MKIEVTKLDLRVHGVKVLKAINAHALPGGGSVGQGAQPRIPRGQKSAGRWQREKK